MGICNTSNTLKIYKKTIENNEKNNIEIDFSKNMTRTSSTNFFSSFKYFCTSKNKT